MKKILVLNYDDHKGGGVIWTFADKLEEQGHQVFGVTFLKRLDDTDSCFVDVGKKYSIAYFLYKLCSLYFRIANKFIYESQSSIFYNCHYYPVSAEGILKKCPFNPNLILIGWYDFYLSPKTIWKLHQLTGAKIVISMIDEFILGAGCHYPFACEQYKSGCTDCPAIKRKNIAAKIWRDKIHYFKELPLVVAGTSYDLNCFKSIEEFSQVRTVKNIGIPHPPFVMSKEAARKIWNIGNDDFCMLFGATNFNDKRKGLVELLDSLNFFLHNQDGKRNVTILMLGNANIDIDEIKYGENVRFVKTGYVSRIEMFKAYFACDIFVSPTLADSGPYMVNYATACGRPTVAFPIGVAVDLCIPGETGYLAEYKDVHSFAKGIDFFYGMSKQEYEAYSQNCLDLMRKLELEKPWYLRILED